jgi:hypothetical protein
MVVYYYDEKTFAKKIKVKFDVDNDWISDDDSKCTYVFYSLDDFYNTINEVYPLAKYEMKVHHEFNTIFVMNFDNRLYEYKNYRKVV